MATVQLPWSKQFNTQMLVHITTQNNDVILSQEFLKHFSNESRKHGIIDNGKQKKMPSKKNWTDRDHHVQHNKFVNNQDMKMYCATNQFPE